MLDSDPVDSNPDPALSKLEPRKKVAAPAPIYESSSDPDPYFFEGLDLQLGTTTLITRHLFNPKKENNADYLIQKNEQRIIYRYKLLVGIYQGE